MRLIRLLKNDLALETAQWVREKIITQPQAEQICMRYGADYHQAQQRRLGYTILVGLGYLFIGLAIITLLGANWDAIPRMLRMCGIITLTMTVQGYALHTYRSGNTQGAVGLFFLGNMIYGAAIILIAQIYHLGEHMPDGVFWWAIGCLPLGILLKSSWLSLQSLLLGSLWLATEVFLGYYPILYPIFLLATGFVLYKGRSSLVLFFMFFVSSILWFEITLSQLWRDHGHFDFDAEHFIVTVSLFMLISVFSHWLSRRPNSRAKDYAAIMTVWCLRLGLILMIFASFKDPWDALIREHWQHKQAMIAIVGCLLTGSFILAYKTKMTAMTHVIIPLFLIVFVALLHTQNTHQAFYFQIGGNIALMAAGIAMIVQGIHQGNSHSFFLGIASILLTAFIRYVDLIGDYVGGAVLFMVFAAVLLGAAKYWKRHQRQEGMQ